VSNHSCFRILIGIAKNLTGIRAHFHQQPRQIVMKFVLFVRKVGKFCLVVTCLAWNRYPDQFCGFVQPLEANPRTFE
jgi:hypothetical protein